MCLYSKKPLTTGRLGEGLRTLTVLFPNPADSQGCLVWFGVVALVSDLLTTPSCRDYHQRLFSLASIKANAVCFVIKQCVTFFLSPYSCFDADETRCFFFCCAYAEYVP